MKRFFLLILVLLLLPVISFSEEPDPIVGSYYILLNLTGTPFESSADGIVTSVFVVTFDDSGRVYYLEQDFYDDKSTSKDPRMIGEWKKEDSKYIVSILYVGTKEAYFENDILYVALFVKDQYYALRKMTPIDLYEEVFFDY